MSSPSTSCQDRPITGRRITKILIANRGEIARRIQRTARQMGIATVAVYADPDAAAPFVREADEAIALGGMTSAETYLDVDKVLAAARRTGADAIHPGYGFLAENADFAAAVENSGLVWVGPAGKAIAAMGDKLSAKRLLKDTDVPTLPSIEVSDDVDLEAAAQQVGFPLLVKASAGGGGKGMRVVENASRLEEAVSAARREAKSAFGDGTVFLERWLEAAHHVEVQLLGDKHGHLVHCYERECSIQRRHQKIVEEAPSPALSESLRAKMGKAAIEVGAAIDYYSVGTVEFLLEGDDFWFLEMNTRLQVEHPVTEAITGLDLVREQILVACGHPLSFGQEDLAISGHAIEARLYAEDPANGFLPATGTLLAFEAPDDMEARFDSGVESGSTIGIEFDPMLAKVIVHAPTRAEASARLARTLETTRIQGVVTNRDFLVSVLRSNEFQTGVTTTNFLEQADLVPHRERTESELGDAALCATFAAQLRRRAAERIQQTIPSGFRNSVMPPEQSRFKSGDTEIQVLYQSVRSAQPGAFRVHVEVRSDAKHDSEIDSGLGPEAGNDSACGTENLHRLQSQVQVVDLGASDGDGEIQLVVDGRRFSASITSRESTVAVHGPFGDLELTELPRFPLSDGADVGGGLVAPMPGKVLAIHCAEGDRVERGELLLLLEAMKMEHRVTAPATGTVTEVRVSEGDQVENKALLVVLVEDS